MAEKRKIAVVITSRASYARVKSVLRSLQKKDGVELIVIGAGSLLLEKYGEAVRIIEEEGISITEKVYMVVEGENPTTMAKTVGIGIIELATIFDNYRPDIVITVADRFETIATAIAASYLNIPVAHIQGGEITGSIDEKVRHAVTKLSSLHFVANEHAARRVKMMGENPQFIFTTGCPSIDLANEVMKNPSLNIEEFYSKYRGVGTPVDLNKDFIVIMQHPDTTEYDSAFEQMKETLEAIYELRIPTILFWPNMDAGSDKVSKAIRIFRENYNSDFIFFLKNIDPENFLRLLIHSKCIVGNSSVGIRECSFLGVPAVNIGLRQNGRERGGNIIDVNYNKQEIIKAVETHFKNGSKYESSHLYGDGKAGERIATILAKEKLPVKKSFMENF